MLPLLCDSYSSEDPLFTMTDNLPALQAKASHPQGRRVQPQGSTGGQPSDSQGIIEEAGASQEEEKESKDHEEDDGNKERKSSNRHAEVGQAVAQAMKRT